MTCAAFTLREAEAGRLVMVQALADPEAEREPGILWSYGGGRDARSLALEVATAPLSALVHDGELPGARGESSYRAALRWARAAGYSGPSEQAHREGSALREAWRFHLGSGGEQPQSATALALARAERQALAEGWELGDEPDCEEPGCSEVTLYDADGEALGGLGAVEAEPGSLTQSAGYGRTLFASLALDALDRFARAAREALLGAARALEEAQAPLEPSLYHTPAYALLGEFSERLREQAERRYGAERSS